MSSRIVAVVGIFLAGLFGVFAQTSAQGTYSLEKKDSSYVLTQGGYPLDDFEIEGSLTWREPGSVLDTIGINAAPSGSWNVLIGADGRVTFGIWDSRTWTQATTKTAIAKGTATTFRVRRQAGVLQVGLGDTYETQIRKDTPLSGRPVFVGDFKGDESWGAGYNISQSFIGQVTIKHFGSPRAEAGAAGATLVEDRTGTVSASAIEALRGRLSRFSAAKQVSIGFIFTGAAPSDQLSPISKDGLTRLRALPGVLPKCAVFVLSADRNSSAHFSGEFAAAFPTPGIQQALQTTNGEKDFALRAEAILVSLFGKDSGGGGGTTTGGGGGTTTGGNTGPVEPIAGESKTIPAGQQVDIPGPDGALITIPAQSRPVQVTVGKANMSASGLAALALTGPTIGMTWQGDVDPDRFIPKISFSAGVTQGMNIVRIGDAIVDGQLVRNVAVALPTLVDKQGRLSALDTMVGGGILPPGATLLATIHPVQPGPSSTVKYGLASYMSGLNWRVNPELVRMRPDETADQRTPFPSLSDTERKKARKKAIKNVIILVHGHNEVEKGGYESGSGTWGVAYKKDVWTLFYKQAQMEFANHLNSTAFYEFIYPSYRPVFGPEMGMDGLGTSLAQAVASDEHIAEMVKNGQEFNLYIVAHSMGGLVARAGVNEFSSANMRSGGNQKKLEEWLRAVATWGSPHHGSPLVTLRYLLTGGYDLAGSALVPISLLKNKQSFVTAINRFAAMDTPGERALRWDNRRPLNLDKAGWQLPKREISSMTVDEWLDERDLAVGTWLYNAPLQSFNQRDKFRGKVIPLYGITSKTITTSVPFWAKIMPSSVQLGARIANSADIAKGTFLTDWLYQNSDSVAGVSVKQGDGAVPVESMIGDGLFASRVFLGDVDHEEYYGAPDSSGALTAEGKGLSTASRTFYELGFRPEDKTSRPFPPQVDYKLPMNPGKTENGEAAFKVEAKLVWPGDSSPGARMTGAKLIALNLSRPTAPEINVPCELEFKADGTVSGLVRAQDIPAAPQNEALGLVVRCLFKDATELDSKASIASDVLETLHRTNAFNLSILADHQYNRVNIDGDGKRREDVVNYVVGQSISPPECGWGVRTSELKTKALQWNGTELKVTWSGTVPQSGDPSNPLAALEGHVVDFPFTQIQSLKVPATLDVQATFDAKGTLKSMQINVQSSCAWMEITISDLVPTSVVSTKDAAMVGYDVKGAAATGKLTVRSAGLFFQFNEASNRLTHQKLLKTHQVRLSFHLTK